MMNRLDVAVYLRGLADSREKAKNLIANGNVYVNGKPAIKASCKVSNEDTIEIKGEIMPYVSRGGLKLKKAVDVFSITLVGKIAIDMGASTGGFTDCMLQSGASKVYAVDVGSGQLADKIKNDSRVVNMENTNIREMKREDIPEEIDFISVDTSFISLKLILPTAFMFLKKDGEIVALIKPQFEAGRENIGKNGIVKDKKVHIRVIEEIYSFVISLGFVPTGLTISPITGGDGNVEYLMHIKKEGTAFSACEIKKTVL